MRAEDVTGPVTNFADLPEDDKQVFLALMRSGLSMEDIFHVKN